MKRIINIELANNETINLADSDLANNKIVVESFEPTIRDIRDKIQSNSVYYILPTGNTIVSDEHIDKFNLSGVCLTAEDAHALSIIMYLRNIARYVNGNWNWKEEESHYVLDQSYCQFTPIKVRRLNREGDIVAFKNEEAAKRFLHIVGHSRLCDLLNKL